MLYGMGVVAASGYVSRVVDRTRNTESILFWGAAISGMGLVWSGSWARPLVGNGLLSTVVVIAGVILVGLAHGFINAPVVTHVAHSDLATRSAPTRSRPPTVSWSARPHRRSVAGRLSYSCSGGKARRF